MDIDTDYSKEIQDIIDILEEAGGMIAEIVLWGLKNMKENPELTPVQALYDSLNDWIK